MTAIFAWVALALGLQLSASFGQSFLGNGSDLLSEDASGKMVFGIIRQVSSTSFSLCLKTCVRVLQAIPAEWEGKKAWVEGRREKSFLLPKSKNAVDVIG